MNFKLKLIIELKKYIKAHLSEKSYEHSLKVSKLAKKLGYIYNQDILDLEIAALGHDIAKNLPHYEQSYIMHKYDADHLKQLKGFSLSLSHGFCSAIILKKEFNISNEDILNAIRYHSLGRAQMNTFEKIIYVSDTCCSKKQLKRYSVIKSISKKNLDRSVSLALDTKITKLKEQGLAIHPYTEQAQEYFSNILN